MRSDRREGHRNVDETTTASRSEPFMRRPWCPALIQTRSIHSVASTSCSSRNGAGGGNDGMHEHYVE
jgi:hypothetical protein